jgi:hypothetical protein
MGTGKVPTAASLVPPAPPPVNTFLALVQGQQAALRTAQSKSGLTASFLGALQAPQPGPLGGSGGAGGV